MNSQISMFQMLDEYETPQIPLDEQKMGGKGWIIDISAICLKKNGYKEEWTGVETRPVIFLRDTRKDRDGFTWQHCETTKGPLQGWSSAPKRIFRKRPSWADCLKYGREKARKEGYPEDIRFYSRDGDFNGIYEYEKGH
jgi:hypothetical protein